MQDVRPRVSYADLERWPDDGRRYELYDGEVSVVPAPLPRHQRVLQKIVTVLAEYERSAGGLVFDSPVDIVFTQYDVVQPDAVFFVRERIAPINMRAAIRLAPDLAVEVLSPSTAATDRGKKLRLLAHFGVREYWLVDPIENTIERHVLQDGGYVLDAIVSESDVMASRALTGLSFPAARVFTL